MTPDEIAKLIPDEVVEEAAKHAFIYYKSIPWDECTDKNLWRSLARAALAAGLAVWPGGVRKNACLVQRGGAGNYHPPPTGAAR